MARVSVSLQHCFISASPQIHVLARSSQLSSSNVGAKHKCHAPKHRDSATLPSPNCRSPLLMHLWQSDQLSGANLRSVRHLRIRKGVGRVGDPGILTGSRRKMMRKSVIGMSIVGPECLRTLFVILTGCAAIGQVLETRTKWGRQLSGPLLAMGAAAALSGVGVTPTSSPIYDMVFSTLMPLGAALTLLELNVWTAFNDAGSTLKAFVFGALGTVLGTIVSFKLIGPLLGPDGWKIASSLCSSYVGGSINYAATAQTLGLHSANLLAAGMAADNLAMGLYFGIIMAIPESENQSLNQEGRNIVSGSTDVQPQPKTSPTVESVAVSIAAAATACIAGDAIASVLPSSFRGSGLAFMAVVAAIFNALASQLHGGAGQTSNLLFAGSHNLGGALMLLFFAVVGASTGLKEAMTGGWPLSVFIVILIAVHMTTILSLGWLSRLPMRSILVASNANIGGPATAAAMANARNWPGLIRPALLAGTLGYTIGTAIGCIVGVHVLRPMV